MLASERPRTREVPGGGARWEAGGRAIGYLGHALIDRDSRVIYAGIFRAPAGNSNGTAGPLKNEVPQAEPEEDPTKRRGGRFNPFRNGGRLPGATRDPLVPPR